MNKKKKIVIVVIMLVLMIVAALAMVALNGYPCEDFAKKYIESTEIVTVEKIKQGYFFDGEAGDKAFIFYPGAQVEPEAYAPMLHALAEGGIDCFLLEMPLDFAFLGRDKATDILSEYQYETWYVGGHSLGGAMAAKYASEHIDDLDGVILLGAYSVDDLDAEHMKVLAIYGSEDRVLNRQKLSQGMSYMPEEYTEVCIEGGNHAGFGYYGEQSGDGAAVISKEEQQQITIEAILEY